MIIYMRTVQVKDTLHTSTVFPREKLQERDDQYKIVFCTELPFYEQENSHQHVKVALRATLWNGRQSRHGKLVLFCLRITKTSLVTHGDCVRTLSAEKRCMACIQIVGPGKPAQPMCTTALFWLPAEVFSIKIYLLTLLLSSLTHYLSLISVYKYCRTTTDITETI